MQSFAFFPILRNCDRNTPFYQRTHKIVILIVMPQLPELFNFQLVPKAGHNTQSYHVIRGQQGAHCAPGRTMTTRAGKQRLNAMENRSSLRPLLQWHRLNQFVAVTLCLGQMNDPTFVARLLSQQIPSHAKPRTPEPLPPSEEKSGMCARSTRDQKMHRKVTT